METSGLIFRTYNPDDRRTMSISLSEKGRKEAEIAEQQRKQRHAQMFACLSEGEKNTLLGLLERLNDSWECLNCEKSQDYSSNTGA